MGWKETRPIPWIHDFPANVARGWCTLGEVEFLVSSGRRWSSCGRRRAAVASFAAAREGGGGVVGGVSEPDGASRWRLAAAGDGGWQRVAAASHEEGEGPDCKGFKKSSTEEAGAALPPDFVRPLCGSTAVAAGRRATEGLRRRRLAPPPPTPIEVLPLFDSSACSVHAMQPVRQPFQLVDQDMPEANMGMPEQMPHFPQLGHHMPQSGLVLPAPRAVLPGGYMPNMGAPMQPPFYTYQQMWVPVLVQPQLGTTQHHTMSASLPSVSSSEPSPLDWQEHVSCEGKEYYYNRRTRQSSWYKPAELMTPLERADATTDWKEHTTDEGRKYYHNRVTKKSEWTIPEELKIARELAENALSQRPDQYAQTTAGGYVGSSYAASSTHDAVAVVSERLDQELRI
ncbi:hypothetical protein ZWY2020_053192 [Hordeum vulgare]|nr:hypothetical protein ZWY2020_053192 [Hordeum vulgare]